jgi:hypothetical protein
MGVQAEADIFPHDPLVFLPAQSVEGFPGHSIARRPASMTELQASSAPRCNFSIDKREK